MAPLTTGSAGAASAGAPTPAISTTAAPSTTPRLVARPTGLPCTALAPAVGAAVSCPPLGLSPSGAALRLMNPPGELRRRKRVTPYDCRAGPIVALRT
ncbi:hypothetical protein GCM10018780_76240 [Streptomyces lanatus]|nr:hypothetical protein GCM10018780_76240 [Streptomyces lanatus]